jgi:hypothetical protein
MMSLRSACERVNVIVLAIDRRWPRYGLLELGDEGRQRPAERDGDGRLPVDVVVVEEDDEEPDVLARGLGARVIARSDLERRLAARLRLAVQADELHGVDLLADAVLLHLEIVRCEAGDGCVAPAEDRDVHADDLHARAEDRRLRLLLLLLRRRLLRRRFLLLRGRLL